MTINKMDSKIISEGIKPEILELLHNGNLEEVQSEIGVKRKKENGFFSFLSKSKNKSETDFTYTILPYCLNKTLKPEDYTKISKLDFKKDFLSQLKELFRIVLVLKDYSKEPEVEKLVALVLKECIGDGAVYIE